MVAAHAVRHRHHAPDRVAAAAHPRVVDEVLLALGLGLGLGVGLGLVLVLWLWLWSRLRLGARLTRLGGQQIF